MEGGEKSLSSLSSGIGEAGTSVCFRPRVSSRQWPGKTALDKGGERKEQKKKEFKGLSFLSPLFVGSPAAMITSLSSCLS